MADKELDSASVKAPDPQLEAAKSAGNVYKFEGHEYAKYIANRTASVGVAMMHPANKTQKIAILGADFLWTDDTPFLDHLNLEIKDERNVREQETRQKHKNITDQAAVLFQETVQRGWIVKFEADGTESDRIEKTRDEMLQYAPEIQADLVGGWLGKVSSERYFPEGSTDIDALLSEPESVWFKIKVGDYQAPAHVFLLEFGTPTREQRKAYENDTLIAGSRKEGDVAITDYMINHKAKLRFARKHLRSVSEGAVLGPDMILDFDADTLQAIDSPDKVKQFGERFNPNWLIGLADSLADCFNFGGK